MYSTIIETSELNQLYQDKKPFIVFDCRFNLFDTQAGFNAYCEKRIPTAHYLHLDNHLSSLITASSGRHPLPSRQKIESLFDFFNITPEIQVVLYDAQNHAFASRAWWLFQALGHKNCAVLNGGFNAWQSQQNKVETGTLSELDSFNPIEVKNQEDPGAFDFVLPVVSQNELCNCIKDTTHLLIDAREAQRFEGIQEPIDPVAGHIPTAINAPMNNVIDANGFFYDKEKLRQYWGNLGAADKNVIHYCGSGVTACVNILSFAIAELPIPTLYAGGWSEWCKSKI
ncbi:sulfurtransferase [Sessilibacter sp. MAH1]